MRRLALVLPVPVLAVLLYGVNLGGFPGFTDDDEGTYYAQAWAVLTEGRLAHYTYWFDHPPLGWIQLAALLRPAAWAAGDQPVLAGGRLVVALVMAVSATLLYRLARNLLLPRVVAYGVVAIWCLSPLTLFYGRRVLLDTVALMWLLASLVLATRPALRHRAVWSGLCFGVAVLSKETAVLAGLGVLLATDRRRRWLAAAAAPGLAWLAVVTIGGDLLPLLSTVEWQLHGREGTGFFLDAGSVAHGIVLSWWERDPFLLVLGLAAVGAGLFRREVRAVALIPVVSAVAGLRPGGYLPAMHVIMVLPFLALLVGWAAYRVVLRLPAPATWVRPATAVALTAVAAVWWTGGVRTALTADRNADYRQALAYASGLPRDTVVLTDDVTWNDLVRLGWSGDGWHGPLWHFKLDRDPRAVTELPGGWRDVDYVLAGPAMQPMLGTPAISWAQSPEVVSAWHNSTVVASWGAVSLRRVDPSGALGCRQRVCPVPEPVWTTPARSAP